MKLDVYHRVTGQLTPEESVPQSDSVDAARYQLRINWLQSTITREMVDAISGERDSLVRQAIQQACSYPQHTNHHQIIQLLVRADALQKVIETYATTA